MKKIAIVYWSGTGNTKAMANEIAAGAKDAGMDVSVFTAGEFATDTVDRYDKLAFGCSSMGDEELEDMEFEPMFSAIESRLLGKEIALFGSYGWGDGEWMRLWQERCQADGAIIFNDEGLIVNEMPDDEGLAQCRDFGKDFASA